VPAVPTQPIVIDLPAAVAPGDQALRDFYESLLARLQTAQLENDPDTMEALVDSWLRDDAPEWARARLLGFRALARGIRFERHALRTASIAVRPADGAAGDAPAAVVAAPPAVVAAPAAVVAAPAGTDASAGAAAAPPDPEAIGTPLLFELTVPPLTAGDLTLHAYDQDDPIAFHVEVSVRDQFVDGSVRDHGDGDVVRLRRAVALREGPLRVPVRIDLGPSGAVRRRIDLRIDLLPGYAFAGDERVPLHRTTLAATVATQWPAGHRELRKAPLPSLRAALQQPGPAQYLRVWLAAEFAPAADRAAVEAALIDWVRLGSNDQATVAMAALHALGAAQIPVGDRDGWLAWWQSGRQH